MINKKSFSEQIYESIRDDIINQKIGFGEKLVNRELQKKFGVSSSPVRDAINRLYQDGLVEDISKGGAVVITFDLKNALEINDIMSVLNSGAIKMSAEKANFLELVPVLQKCIDQQNQYIDSKRYFEYDYSYHNAFFEFSDNSRYKKLFAQYQTLWVILVQFYYSDKNMSKKNTISQHQRILDAYKNNDIQTARALIEQHYKEAVPPLQKALMKAAHTNS